MKRLLPSILAAWLPLVGILSASGEPDWTGWRVGGSPAISPPETGQAMQPLALEPSVQAPLAEALETGGQPSLEPQFGILSAYTPELPQSVPPGDGELIAETSRGLDYSWARCYLFVRDHIRFTPYPGILRGPERTLLDREGNAADQALLLVALLRASGYTATLMHVAPPADAWTGGFRIPLGGTQTGYDAATWLGCATGTVAATWSDVGGLLASAGLKAYCGGSGSSPVGYDVRLEHYWAGIVLDGYLYYLDPSFKPRQTTPSRDILADAGYSRASLLTTAGGTVGTSSVQGISSAALGSALDGLAAQLAAAWHAADPVAAPKAFVGGDAVVPQDLSWDGYTFHGAVDGTLLDFMAQTDAWKNARRTALTVTHGTTSKKLWLDEVAARHVWLSYTNAPGYAYPKAVLRVDDEPVLTEPAGSAQAAATMTLAVDHPYADMSAPYSLVRAVTNVYVIALGMGGDHPGGMRARAAVELARTRSSGADEADVALCARALQSVGQQWLAQTALLNDLDGRLTGVRQGFFYNLGVAGQAGSPYVDLKNCYTYTSGDPARFGGTMLFASALEHAVLDQVNGPDAPAVSTVRILDLANAADTPIHFATHANYASTVRPALINYPAAQLNAFAAALAAGGTLLLPRDGATVLNQWQGTGWIEHGPSGGGWSTGMIISGGLAGGFTSVPGNISANSVDAVHCDIRLGNAAVSQETAADPVEQPSGAYVSDRTDLALAAPVPLAWTRHYDSRRRFDDGPLGRGWTHGYDAVVVRHADPDARFGRTAPEAAAPTALAVAVVADLLEDQGTLSAGEEARRRTLAALVVQWWTERLTGGAASVRLGARALAFQRNPDGTYAAAPGVTATLAETNGLFTLTERLGDTYAFDASNRLASVTDRSGNAVTLHYGAEGRLAAVSNSFGRALSLSWSGGRVASAADSAGRSVSYAYDASGCLTNAADAAGFAWIAAYDVSGALLSQTDPEGNAIIQNAYNGLGQVTGQVSSAGQPWVFGYAAGTRSWDTDPYGRREVRDHDAEGRVVSRVRRDGAWHDYVHDARGRLVTHLDPFSRANLFEYDGYDRLVRSVQAANTPDARATAFAYDALHRLVAVTNALGLATTFAYDGNDRLVLTTFPDGTAASNAWNAVGLRASETLLDASGQILRHTVFAYDGGGRPASRTTQGPGLPSSVETSTDFDGAGNLVRIEDANGRETLFQYDARGLLTNSIDAAGHAVCRAHGPRGLPASVTDPRGRTTGFLWTSSGDPAAVLLPDGSGTTNAYDAVDRLAAVTDPRGTRVDLERDDAGRVTRRHTPRWEERTWYDIVGCATSVLDAASVWTDFGYDWLDRPVLATDGLGRGWWTAFDALDRVTGATDPRGRSRQYAHDPLGRRTAAIKPSGATDAFGYDGLGNWTAYTNAEGRVYRMAYDALGRLVAATNAANEQVFANRYDPAGNLTNRTDGAGNTIAYSYDVLNRLVRRESGVGGPASSFAHDPVGNLLSASNETATLTFGYDAMDRLITATTALSNATYTYTVTYRRDAGGLVTNLVYASGKAVTRAYDPDGRLTAVSDWLGHTWTFVWDGAGKPTGGSSPGGIVATSHYDAAGRLSAWSVGSLAGRTITRDEAGLKTREDITAGPLPVPAFVRYAENTFDAADRLVAAQVRYGSHTNAAVSETYQYDGNGALTNLVSGSNVVFSAAYDPLGQLGSLSQPSTLNPQTFFYDALGNRVVSGDRLWLPDHADPLKRPLIEADAATGEPIRYYLWGPGRLLGFIDAASGTLTVAHCDEYGSVVALTSENGTVLHTACYGPNGQDWGATGTNPTPFAWLGGHGVQKVAVSDHLGPLYLTRYRLYSASLQRFLSPDPLGLVGGLNLYAYAEGDPLTYIDPLGLKADGMWYDQASDWLSRVTGTAKDYYNNTLPWGVAGTLNTAIDVVTGIGHTPAAIGHLGEGTGTFSADPSWQNLPGVVSDALVVGSVLSVTASALPSLNGSAAAAATPKSADTIAEGMRVSPYRVTGSGETYIRYESANPAFSKVTPTGGVKPGTFAAPASDGLVPIGQRASTYNLPNPEILRPNATTLAPPAGTPIIGPRPVSGGTGNEVIFWMGY